MLVQIKSRSQGRWRQIGACLLIGVGLLLVLLANNQPTTAETFDPGHIIDDSVMTDFSSITSGQIETFLQANVKDGQCNRYKTSARSEQRDLTPPWTCLFEFQQNPITGAHNYGQFDANGQPQAVAGGLSAAEIIWQAAQDHQINPQVILVWIQQQQGLITDDWPWASQYSAATGWVCPDQDPCLPEQAAFWRQIDGFAAALRAGLDNPDDATFQIGPNQIAYHPTATCGQATITIQTQATAILYGQALYTPNQAALDNLYGEGDGCSSYGVRNFWIQFNAWFGSTTPDKKSNPLPPEPTWPVVILNNQAFDAGEIISDFNFTNAGSMTPEQIHWFIGSRLPDADPDQPGTQCARWRQSDYSRQIGLVPPWTCLFEFQQNPVTGVHNFGQFDANGQPQAVAGGLSAAEIIWQASQDHQINPQVLLVLLEKEQSLLSDQWPWPRNYSKATGWACPDTAPCDPQAASFHHQVKLAAAGLRRYIDNLDRYWYRIGTNQILFHPHRNCGTRLVDIKNKATVALYLYTPYQPNAAALNNLRSTGDDCSSYGNRNFWTYYNDWFGAPLDDNSSLYQGPSQSLPTNDRPETPAAPETPDEEPADFEPTDFSVGHIISNADFANHQTMTIEAIDAFLRRQLKDSDANQPGPQCDRYRTANRAATSRQLAPPWTCLFEFQQNPITGAHNYGQFDANGQPQAVAGGLSAAEMIWQASQDHQINPQVLLAIIEKEQWLVSDNWPWSIQFSRPAGQDCPATDCNDPGRFDRQIQQLAQDLSQQFRQPDQRTFKIGANQIAYHRHSGCGHRSVMIHNAATAALYNQDPYVANKAATAGSLTATGDSCSSYGIRNFWVIYRAWFKS